MHHNSLWLIAREIWADLDPAINSAEVNTETPSCMQEVADRFYSLSALQQEPQYKVKPCTLWRMRHHAHPLTPGARKSRSLPDQERSAAPFCTLPPSIDTLLFALCCRPRLIRSQFVTQHTYLHYSMYESMYLRGHGCGGKQSIASLPSCLF